MFTPQADWQRRSRLDFSGGLEGHELHMNCAGHGLLTATSVYMTTIRTSNQVS